MAGMRDEDALLACVAELALTVGHMVELARARRWESLPGLDAHCAGLFERLREMDADLLDGAGDARLLSLAGRIRAGQAELSALVRPQFQNLVRRMAQRQHAS